MTHGRDGRRLASRTYARRAFRLGSVVLLSIVTACTRFGSSPTPTVLLNPQTNAVEVTGLPAATLKALAGAPLGDDQWQALLRVSVKAADAAARPAAVAGRYAVSGQVLRFTPMFPFDDGRQYDVVFDPSRLPGGAGDDAWRRHTIAAVVGKPAIARTPSTVVSHVYPSGDTVPANQLRLYVHFSAPMDWRSGLDYLVLLDDQGKEVVDTFLPLDADFWNEDRTRYTVFLDPGRVKRGILPNRQLGRALEAGRTYTFVVKRDWRDGYGQPLKEEFRWTFRATPAIERPLTMESWTVNAPAAGTREPLSVTFPDALDHGLLQRALGVARDRTPLAGDVAIDVGETRWRFTPRDPWTPGDYELVALAFLEDLAGNRIGRAFEVDNFERTDRTPEPERTFRPFRIASTH